MQRLHLGDVVRAVNGRPDRHGEVVDFAEEDGVCFVLVTWRSGEQTAEPEETLEVLHRPASR